MEQVFKMQRRVEFMDTDMAGIVHFTAFFRYMETAEHEFLRSIGLPIDMQHRELGLGWPRVACDFNYRNSLRFPETFEVRLGVTQIGKKSVTYIARIVKDERVLAQGHSTSACCRIMPDRTLRSTPIPDDIVEKLRPYLVGTTDPAGDENRDTLKGQDA